MKWQTHVQPPPCPYSGASRRTHRSEASPVKHSGIQVSASRLLSRSLPVRKKPPAQQNPRKTRPIRYIRNPDCTTPSIRTIRHAAYGSVMQIDRKPVFSKQDFGETGGTICLPHRFQSFFDVPKSATPARQSPLAPDLRHPPERENTSGILHRSGPVSPGKPRFGKPVGPAFPAKMFSKEKRR